MPAVKVLRIWLLLLLAVLLPVRGAVAAAMLCPMGTASHEAVVDAAAQDPHAGHHGHDAGAGKHGHGHGHGHDQQGHATPDKCNLCSAYCSLTPLASEPPSLPERLEPTAVKFPDVSSPAPTFLSGGQERPPRSI